MRVGREYRVKCHKATSRNSLKGNKERLPHSHRLKIRSMDSSWGPCFLRRERSCLIMMGVKMKLNTWSLFIIHQVRLSIKISNKTN